MAPEPSRKSVKTGVEVGGGPPPGYKWNVKILDRAHGDALKILNKSQYDHLARQVRELATQEDPSHSTTIDVAPIEDFLELKDKGGILRKLNVRIFFFVHKEDRSIVVLGAIGKQNDGATPQGDKVLMRNRKGRYLEAFTADKRPRDS